MRYIVTFILTVLGYSAFAQPVQLGSGDSTKTNLIKGSLQVNKDVTLKSLPNSDPSKVLTTNAQGKVVLSTVTAQAVVDSSLYVTVTRLRDSLAAVRADIGGAVVDSSVYVTITRLIDSLNGVRTYIATNYYNKTESDGRYLQEEVDGDTTNELQTLSLGVDDSLQISSGNKVKLPYIRTETDPEWNSEKGNYYSKAQTDSIAAGKADSAHTHPLSEVTAAGNTTPDTIIAEDYRFNGMTYSEARAAALYHYDDTVKVATGILRQVQDGSSLSWRIVKWDDPDFTTYAAVRLDSVVYSSSMYIYVYFGDTAARIISCHVTVDDDFALAGVIAGPSIGLDYVRVNFTWDKGNHGGIMYRDGTGWHYSFALEATSVTEIGTNGIEWAETQTLQQGGYLTPSSDYLGFLSGGYEIKYLGSKGYTLKHATGLPPTKRHYLIDAYGNDVPLTTLDATDIFQVTSNRSIRHFNPGNSNNWNVPSAGAIFITMTYK